jgi:excisionase family DNA binding protein
MEPGAAESQAPLESTLTASYKESPSTAIPAHIANGEHECMTAKELASWMRVDRKTVYEYAARNVIPCRRLGRRLVFLRPAIAAWLACSSTGNALPGAR